MKFPIASSSTFLYPNLSYKDFFETYNPYIDGQVYIATYSFNPSNFDFWAKLEPLSVIYIHEKHKNDALNFLKRFPLFEVYSVKQLHTKAIFFTKSNRFLLGSENLYMPKSSFSELMLETTISEDQEEEIINIAFHSLKGEILTPKFELSDINIDLEGHPYLPCEKEVTYWDLLANKISIPGGKPPDPEYHNPSYIYHLLEYDVFGITHVLTFNRGYVYCGDISIEAFQWLIENFTITHYEDENIMDSTASDLCDTSPLKDYFLKYHPIASKHKAIKAYWLGCAKDLKKFATLVQPIERIIITKRKIRRPK